MLFSILAAGILQIVAIYTPLSTILGLTAISLGELVLAIGVSASAFLFFELTKFLKLRV
jgi:hypothetical protein